MLGNKTTLLGSEVLALRLGCDEKGYDVFGAEVKYLSIPGFGVTQQIEEGAFACKQWLSGYHSTLKRWRLGTHLYGGFERSGETPTDHVDDTGM